MVQQSNASRSYYRTLTIAGSDSGGGAGIQADLKTFSTLGCYGMSAITALTTQNTVGVQDIHAAPPKFLGQQIDSIVEDIGVDAIKIGMLLSAQVINTVAQKLDEHSLDTVVLDPVMVAQSGDPLIREEAVEALSEQLIPLATVITPNLPEAARLLGSKPTDTGAVEEAAGQLLEWQCDAVLLKGGHDGGNESCDCLAIATSDRDPEVRWYNSRRVDTENTHGTGCTLSSAIAAFLAKGFELKKAVRQAKEYTTGAIRAGRRYDIGNGSGPLHHFYQF